MYQPDIYNTAYTNHYPNSYPVTTIPAPISYFPPLQTQQPAKIEPVQHDPPEPAVTHKVASKAIERLVLQELKNVGFDRVEQPAVGRLQLEVTTFVQQLFQRAHEYANLANRARAIASDVLLACEDFDLTPRELNKVNKVTAKRKKGRKGGSRTCPIELVKTKSRSPSPELLPSDDEEPSTAATVATTLTNLPVGFPKLPPKHTYLQTPASPPKKAALPSLEKKLKTAALVQESLQNLLTATEDAMNQEDGELLGHIVNWELNVQPRKRWRVKAM